MKKLMTLTGVTAAAALMWGTGLSYAQYVPPPPLAAGVDYMVPNYANSPALTKFIDPLPGVKMNGAAVAGFYNNAGGLNIPIALAETTLPVGVPNDAAYYEIALVDYTQTMHTELGPTKLRGYVQIYPPGSGTTGIQLFYLNAAGVPDTTKPIQVDIGTVAAPNLVNVYAYENPTYLGPMIAGHQGHADAHQVLQPAAHHSQWRKPLYSDGRDRDGSGTGTQWRHVLAESRHASPPRRRQPLDQRWHGPPVDHSCG